jgi:hypothetical protein
VQIFIARDGVEIGEWPREQINELARTGEFQPSDHYWHEGMVDWLTLGELLGPDDWKPLPLVPFYRRRLAIPVAIGGGLLLAAIIAISLINFGSRESVKTSLGSSSAVPPAGSALELRDKAAAELRQRIEQLPARAAPPVNAFYYDVTVNMRKSFATGTPWTAIMRGYENTIDPASQKTTKRTQFTLTADYHNGEWVYRHYRATSTDLSNSSIIEVEEDENAPTPPSLAAMLGLKMKRR